VSNAGLLRSSSLMAAGTITSRITGLFKNVALLAALGSGVLGDTYWVANMLPTVVYTLFIGGAINAVFVPQLVRHRADDPDGGEAYAQRLISAVGLSLLALATLAVLLAPVIVRLYSAGWSPRQLEIATLFARLMLPQIFFYGVFTVLSQVLNTRERFGAPMFAPIVNNLAVIGAAVTFLWVVGTGATTRTVTDGQVALIGLGTLVGSVLQALVLVPFLRRAGFGFRVRFDLKGQGLGRAFSLARWTIGLVAVNQLGTLLVVRLATRANVESPALDAGATVYTNAFTVFMLPQSVITVSVVTALLPRLAQEAHDGRFGIVRARIGWALRVTGALMVPAAMTLVVLGVPIAVLLFDHGSMTSEGARQLGLTLAAYAVGLPAFSAYYVLLRGFYALEDTRSPTTNAVLLNAVNVGLAYLLFATVPADLRVPSLGLSYALAYWVALVVLARRLRRRLGGIDGGVVVRTYVRVSVATVLAGLAMAVAARAFTGGEQITSVTEAAITLVVGLVPAVAVFVAAARLMHIDEVRQVLDLVRGGARG
jgi:putative peptidoglycan lipid II flippase